MVLLFCILGLLFIFKMEVPERWLPEWVSTVLWFLFIFAVSWVFHHGG